MTLDELEALYKSKRSKWDESHRIRVHRAISWMKNAEKYIDDPDVSFMGALNAMNALWGQLGVNDRDAVEALADNLRGTSAEKEIKNLYGSREAQKWLGMLIGNKHLYWQYWRYLQGEMSEDEYKKKAQAYRSYAMRSVKDGKYLYLLKATMTQAVVLRSQVFHGFTSYESRDNRDIIALTAKMMRKLAIIVATAQIEEPNRDWGITPWTFGKDQKSLPQRNRRF